MALDLQTDLKNVPLSVRRTIEAELTKRIYDAALPFLGEGQTLSMLNAAIDEAAREAGRAFAAKAPGGQPCLEHFAQVLDLWQAGGALILADIERGPETLNFTVTQCRYMEIYREMGLPTVLHGTLSCRRDEAFAAGYSRKLFLERPQIISAGAPSCLFRFRWLP